MILTSFSLFRVFSQLPRYSLYSLSLVDYYPLHPLLNFLRIFVLTKLKVLPILLLRKSKFLSYVKRYRRRIEGLFARIELESNPADLSKTYWRSTTKDNIASIYGMSTTTRIADPQNERHIFSWFIEESYYSNSNVIMGEYKVDREYYLNCMGLSTQSRIFFIRLYPNTGGGVRT